MTKKEFLEYVKRGKKAQASVGEILSAREVKKARAKPRHEEDELQIQCLEYFQMRHKKRLIFHVPNAMSFGGSGGRGQFFGKLAKLKKMGLVKGVADLFIAESEKGYHGCFLELKVGKNPQSPEQKQFEIAVTTRGYAYQVVRRFEDFKVVVDWFLSP